MAEVFALDRPALIVIDVQRGFADSRYWGRRDNAACEANIAGLLDRWRREGWPVVFVRHDSRNPRSPLAPGTAGNAFAEAITGTPDLLVVTSPWTRRTPSTGARPTARRSAPRRSPA